MSQPPPPPLGTVSLKGAILLSQVPNKSQTGEARWRYWGVGWGGLWGVGAAESCQPPGMCSEATNLCGAVRYALH